jgi:hypothetical protein
MTISVLRARMVCRGRYNQQRLISAQKRHTTSASQDSSLALVHHGKLNPLLRCSPRLVPSHRGRSRQTCHRIARRRSVPPKVQRSSPQDTPFATLRPCVAFGMWLLCWTV